jgi:hypothetical protein
MSAKFEVFIIKVGFSKFHFLQVVCLLQKNSPGHSVPSIGGWLCQAYNKVLLFHSAKRLHRKLPMQNPSISTR